MLHLRKVSREELESYSLFVQISNFSLTVWSSSDLLNNTDPQFLLREPVQFKNKHTSYRLALESTRLFQGVLLDPCWGAVTKQPRIWFQLQGSIIRNGFINPLHVIQTAVLHWEAEDFWGPIGMDGPSKGAAKLITELRVQLHSWLRK